MDAQSTSNAKKAHLSMEGNPTAVNGGPVMLAAG